MKPIIHGDKNTLGIKMQLCLFNMLIRAFKTNIYIYTYNQGVKNGKEYVDLLACLGTSEFLINDRRDSHSINLSSVSWKVTR